MMQRAKCERSRWGIVMPREKSFTHTETKTRYDQGLHSLIHTGIMIHVTSYERTINTLISTAQLRMLIWGFTVCNLSTSTSELRVRLAPWNRFEPSSKYFTDRSKAVLLLWIFYMYVFFCLVFVMPLCACLVVTCWERADLLALVCGV